MPGLPMHLSEAGRYHRRMRSVRPLAAFLLLLVMTSCADEPAIEPVCRAMEFEGDRFTACPYDSRRQSISLVWRSRPGAAIGSMKKLSRQTPATDVAFAMNAGMFDINGSPIGLYVENGVHFQPVNMRMGAGSFYLKPNGVFWVDATGDPHITQSDDYMAAAPAPLWASQSGPMLVVDGRLHMAFEHDGASRHVRNGVGIGAEHLAIFVISEQPVSFGKLARFFRDRLGSREALYFDGAVSSLWAPSLNRLDGASRLGPIVVVHPAAPLISGRP
ncbi:MAG: hypothetical protein EON93_15790 [Burkholderiales bacterium]|nr:MAG: hypothetical protein EON93_15790 [Burkholderiales bacterium]